MSASPASSLDSANVVLDNLLKDKPPSTLPDELAYIVSAFIPSQPDAHHSKAYLILSAFCQGVRSKPSTAKESADPLDDPLVKIFRPLVTSRIISDEADPFLQGVTFLTALFQVDWQSASVIFTDAGLSTSIMDSVELTPPPMHSVAVASLLGQAVGHKSCRTAIDHQVTQWLEAQSRQTKDNALRTAAMVGLIKLSRGSASDSIATGVGESHNVEDESLAKIMKGMVITNADTPSMTNAVEGLAYVSSNPAIKEALSTDTAFLSSLFSLIQKRKVDLTAPHAPASSPSSLIFGVIMMISNICAYRQRLSEEQTQIEKLKRMAQAGKKPGSEPTEAEKLDDDVHVKRRIRRLVSAGVLESLTSAIGVAGAMSVGIRVQTGKILLDIVEDKDNRGRALQAGASKALQFIIRSGMTATKSKLDDAYLAPIQALAKLSITSSPFQVFGPDDGIVIDAIHPFGTLLVHDSSTLLQRFESIMALTNLSSSSPEVASRIAKEDGLLNKLELLLLEDHVLARRAAMELICNLIGGSDDIFERYTTKSKIQVVLALSDVDDLSTRLAASGALAMLTSTPGGRSSLLKLQLERKRALPILVDLMDPSAAPQNDEKSEQSRKDTLTPKTHPGLCHRGVVCARNLVMDLEDSETEETIRKQAKEAGLLKALASIATSEVGLEVLDPARELTQFMSSNL